MSNPQEIEFDDFLKVRMCVGTIIDVKLNEKAHKAAYVLTIDFGEQGIKTTSAQITEHYSEETLIGEQVIAVMNFPPKRVAGVKSEVLVLASVDKEEGTILIKPERKVKNGSGIL